jgi:hypothetical protein
MGLTAGADKRHKVEVAESQTDLSSVQSVGPDQERQTNTCSMLIGERLCKLEELFEKFVCRKNSAVSLSTEIPSSPTLVESSDKESTFGPPKVRSDSHSNSSIGEGIVSSLALLFRRELIRAAWRSNMDFSAFNTHTGEQTGLRSA